jgi:hypothetical protein
MTLSCYTTNLVEYLGAPARYRLARAIRLQVRTDLPTGDLAFSHHERIDREAGWELAYRGSAQWPSAVSHLAAELSSHGAVLAVGNTRHLPWSPHYRMTDIPHWILLTDWDGTRWRVVDKFDALLPNGQQSPYSGWMHGDQLRTALALPIDLGNHLQLRDEHALGASTAVPTSCRHRWLVRQPCSESKSPTGRWLTDSAEVLEYLADRLATDSRALTNHTDDLWAAARHHSFQQATLPDLPAADWTGLPRALRFAVESAGRGRERPGVVTAAFRGLLSSGDGHTTTTRQRKAHDSVSQAG